MPPSDTATTIEITPRVLKEAQRQANILSTKVKTYYQTDRIKSWAELENALSLRIPDIFKEKEFTYANVCSGYDSFCSFWVATYEQRLKSSLSLNGHEGTNLILKPKLKPVAATSTFGNFKLYPEQEPTFRRIYDSFFPADPKAPFEHAILQDGYPGLGKTIIGAAVIAEAIKNSIHRRGEYATTLQPFMVFCPKTLVEHWIRTFEQFGLGGYVRNRSIVVFGDALFTSDHGQLYCKENVDFYTNEASLIWNVALVPILVILDESHRYNNFKTHRTKCMHALSKRFKRVRFLHLSATPGEKINDMQLFTTQTRRNHLGIFVDDDSFKHFAQLITPRPDKVNRESMKRYRKVLAANIVSAPYVKPPHKAVNVLELCDFYDDKSKTLYETAIERYLVACRKMGKSTAWGRWRRNVELAIFRKTVEPLRAPHLAARAAENFKSGQYATAIGVEFKETISTVAFILADQYGIGREHMSVIWGGRKEFKQVDLIPPAEMERLTRNPKELIPLLADKSFRRRFAISIRYEQDQHEHAESFTEQSARHNKLRELRLLGNQSLNLRQIEIDNFQDNTTRICLFTAATGGVGLSLDKNQPAQLVREGFFSMGYSGKVFAQLLGRLVRRNSIADAIQRICAMRNTVEHWFLAPLIDRKLKATAELTARDLDIDIETLMAEQPPAKDFAATDLMTAMAQAEEDDTVVTDFVPDKTNDDDEDSQESENEEVIDKIIED